MLRFLVAMSAMYAMTATGNIPTNVGPQVLTHAWSRDGSARCVGGSPIEPHAVMVKHSDGCNG